MTIDDSGRLSDVFEIDLENKMVYLAPGLTKRRFLKCYRNSVFEEIWEHSWSSKEEMQKNIMQHLHRYDSFTFNELPRSKQWMMDKTIFPSVSEPYLMKEGDIIEFPILKFAQLFGVGEKYERRIIKVLRNGEISFLDISNLRSMPITREPVCELTRKLLDLPNDLARLEYLSDRTIYVYRMVEGQVPCFDSQSHEMIFGTTKARNFPAFKIIK